MAMEPVKPPERMKTGFYGWWLVAAGALIMALGTVPLFQGATTWFVVLEKNFSWSKAQISWAFALARVEGGIISPAAGYMVQRMGSRRTIFIGLLVMGGGFLLFSRTEHLWVFYLSFVIMSVGMELGTWFPVTTAINNWFQRRRATAFGWSMEGMAVGSIFFIPLLAWSIDPDRFGLDQWRKVAAGIGVAMILLAFPLSRLIRNRPEDYGQLPDGDTVPIEEPSGSRQPNLRPTIEESGVPWKQALRTHSFWFMTLGHGCSGAISVTMAVHLGPMLADRGFSVTTVGLILGVQTALMALFIPIAGYIGDKFPLRKSIFVFSVFQSAAILIVLQTNEANTGFAFAYAILMGIAVGGRLPLTSSMRGAYFGRKDFAMILGISMVPINALMFVAPLFTGYTFDWTDSYDLPFKTLAAVSMVSALFYIMMGAPKPYQPGPVGQPQVQHPGVPGPDAPLPGSGVVDQAASSSEDAVEHFPG